MKLQVDSMSFSSFMLFVFIPNMLDSRDSPGSSTYKSRRKFTNNGQAPLCIVHQSSATVMEEFNWFLSPATGGNTLYSGDIRENRGTFASYFEEHSAKRRHLEQIGLN
jgi:ATP-binding cassette, subfamily G (WHITE), member 2, PDR